MSILFLVFRVFFVYISFLSLSYSGVCDSSLGVEKNYILENYFKPDTYYSPDLFSSNGNLDYSLDFVGFVIEDNDNENSCIYRLSHVTEFVYTAEPQKVKKGIFYFVGTGYTVDSSEYPTGLAYLSATPPSDSVDTENCPNFSYNSVSRKDKTFSNELACLKGNECQGSSCFPDSINSIIENSSCLYEVSLLSSSQTFDPPRFEKLYSFFNGSLAGCNDLNDDSVFFTNYNIDCFDNGLDSGAFDWRSTEINAPFFKNLQRFKDKIESILINGAYGLVTTSTGEYGQDRTTEEVLLNVVSLPYTARISFYNGLSYSLDVNDIDNATLAHEIYSIFLSFPRIASFHITYRLSGDSLSDNQSLSHGLYSLSVTSDYIEECNSEINESFLIASFEELREKNIQFKGVILNQLLETGFDSLDISPDLGSINNSLENINQSFQDLSFDSSIGLDYTDTSTLFLDQSANFNQVSSNINLLNTGLNSIIDLQTNFSDYFTKDEDLNFNSLISEETENLINNDSNFIDQLLNVPIIRALTPSFDTNINCLSFSLNNPFSNEVMVVNSHCEILSSNQTLISYTMKTVFSLFGVLLILGKDFKPKPEIEEN